MWPGRKGQGVNTHALYACKTVQPPSLGTQGTGSAVSVGVISEVYHKESASPGIVEDTKDGKSSVQGVGVDSHHSSTLGMKAGGLCYTEPVSKSKRGDSADGFCIQLEPPEKPTPALFTSDAWPLQTCGCTYEVSR
jgi:hypothetical protein